MKKSSDGLYAVDSTTLDQEAYQKLYGSVFKPLNLFEHEVDHDEEDLTDIQNYRPTTPIEDAVKEPPKDLEAFCQLVRNQIQVKAGIHSVSVNDQRELVNILISELRAIWPDIRKQPPDPFLNNEENKELYRRVAVEIVKDILQLFYKYIGRMKDLNALGVFSAKANISRLKTQLAEETSTSLNILRVRRRVLSIMGKQDKGSKGIDEDSYVGLVRDLVRKNQGLLPFKGLTSRQQASTFFRAFELQNLQNTLDAYRIEQASPYVPDTVQKEKQGDHTADEHISVIPTPDHRDDYGQNEEDEHTLPDGTQEQNIAEGTQEDSSTNNQRSTPHRRPFKKSVSCHELDLKEDMFEDFNLDALRNERRTSVHKLKALYESESEEDETIPTEHFLANDLKKLVDLNNEDDEVKNESIPVDDLPPLLQVYNKYNKKKKYGRKNEVKPIEEVSSEDEVEIPGQKPEVTSSPADVVSSVLPSKGITRTYNVRVSNRIFVSGVTLHSYPAIYNEFKGEVDETVVKNLDSHLFAGDELKEVYDELLGTVSKKHLDFDKDTFVEKCLEGSIVTEHAVSSLSHTKLRDTKSVHDIPSCPVYQPKDPKDSAGPFGQKVNVQSSSMGTPQPQTGKQSGQHQDEKESKTYTSWLAWWRTAISMDDYYKYLLLQDTDFLSNIFQLDDIRAQTSDPEEKRSRPKTSPEKERKAKVLSDTMIEKTRYVDGFWNPNVVMLGGLGKDPDEDVGSCTSSVGFRLGGSPSRLTVPMRQAISSQSRSGSAQRTASRNSQRSARMDEWGNTKTPSLQSRLERIWENLKMTDGDRLDMALKYSSDEFLERLPKVIEKYETVAELVANRESILADLERFEKTASDPNRFFERGPRGRSTARQEEELIRNNMHKRLVSLEKTIRREIVQLEKHYSDEIKYEGRPYLLKMESDKVEMLFWLQQERRKAMLQESATKRRDSQRTVGLPSVKIESAL